MGQKFVRKMRIEKFKLFEELEIDHLSHFNLFVGGNNTGKTSVLESLALALGMPPKDFLPTVEGEFRKTKILATENYSRFFSQHNTTIPIKCVLSVSQTVERENNPHSLAYEITYKDILPPKVVQVSMSIENARREKIDGINWDFHSRPVDSGRFFPMSQDMIETVELLYHEITDEGQKRPFYEDKYIDIIRKYEPTLRIIVKDFRLFNQDRKILQLKSARDKVTRFAQEIDPMVRAVIPEDDSLRIEYEGMDMLMPFSEMGTGFIHIIKLYIAIIAGGVDIILFDEITDGLHPKTIQVLLNHIVPLLVESNIQLFASTHSYDILREMYRHKGEGKQAISTYKLQYSKDGLVVPTYLSWEDIVYAFPMIDLR